MTSERDHETAIAVTDPFVGTIFDKRFHVDERIAAGGFGAIYRATHMKSGHRIALKVLHPTLASDLGVLARFRREGTTLTSLRNPHTITAYEFGQSDKILFIVMELLHGESLYDHYSTHGPLEWKRVVHIARQVCESLEEAHAQGIVHRDLKPTNIHLESVDGDPDFVKVLDFGIAKILRGSDHESGDITNVGQMIGTLDYMSPEQMVGGNVTGQTDIYTLGILMYEMIAGTRPFPESHTAGAALAAMLKTTPEPLYLRAPIPRALDEIVMNCLERETTKRYRSVAQLREDLERLGSDGTPANTSTVRVGKEPEDLGEATAVTPPPELTFEATRPAAPRFAKRADEIPDWDDEDEHAPTSTRRPDGSDDIGKTPVLERASRPSDLAKTPMIERTGRRGDPPLQGAFNVPRVRPQTGQIPHHPHAVALGVAPTAIADAVRSDELDDTSGVEDTTGVVEPRHPDSSRGPGRGGSGPVSGPVAAPYPSHPAAQSGPHTVRGAGGPRAKHPTLPPGAVPPLVGSTAPGFAPPPGQRNRGSQPSMQASPPGSTSGSSPNAVTVLGPHGTLQPPRPATPLGGIPHMAMAPHAQPLPTTPVPSYIPPTPPLGALPPRMPTAQYDMGQLAARDTLIRRVVWAAIIVVAAVLGFVIASQI